MATAKSKKNNSELATSDGTRVPEPNLTTDGVPYLSVQQRIKQNESLIKSIAPMIKTNFVDTIDKKKYVKVAGGMAIANALGYAISTDDPIYHDNDDGQYYTCRAHLIDNTTGVIVAHATGTLGMDEDRWADQALYARHGMCSSRSIARLLRQNFGHFYVTMGYCDTPAEEVPQGGFGNGKGAKNNQSNRKPKTNTASKDKGKKKDPAPDRFIELHVAKVDEFSKKDADWTKYTIFFAEGGNATTFSDTHSDTAKEAKESGEAVIVKFTGPNKYNDYEIDSIALENAEEDGPEEEEGGPIDTTATEIPNDDIPF